jgi:hypothetical protein
LYLLHNFVVADVAFHSRYASLKTEAGYYPVSEDDAYYPLYLSVVNAARLEVLDMTCDIESGLNAIAEALSELSINVSCGGGGGGDGGSVVAPCVQNVPNDNLLGPSPLTQGNPDTDPPPDGFATWSEYFDYKCKAAAFIWELERKYMVALKNFEGLTLVASVVSPVVAGLAGVLPAAFTPAGFVVFVSSVVAIGVVAAASWFYMDEMIDWWDSNKQSIICSLYNSGTSAEAVAGLANLLEDAIQAITAWGSLEPVADEIAELLSGAFAKLAGNGVVEPLFKAVVAATQFEYDCSPCDDVGADLWKTAMQSPYNVLLKGDAIVFNAQSAAYGYQFQNSGQEVEIYFTVPGTVSDWEWSAYLGAPDHPGVAKTGQARIEWDGPTGWVALKYWNSLPIPADVWAYFSETVDDVTLEAGEDYRMVFDLFEFNDYGWVRATRGDST